MTDMLDGVPDARLRAPHISSSHRISPHLTTSHHISPPSLPCSFPNLHWNLSRKSRLGLRPNSFPKEAIFRPKYASRHPRKLFFTICLIHLDAVSRYRIDELRSSDDIVLDSLRRVLFNHWSCLICGYVTHVRVMCICLLCVTVDETRTEEYCTVI